MISDCLQISNKMLIRIFFCCLATLRITISSPIVGEMNTAHAMNYLRRLGYIGEESPDKRLQSLTDPEAIKNGIIDFQIMAHINTTGVLDPPTQEAMTWPRCGNKDKENQASVTRRKRYVTEGSRWGKERLTYRILKYTPDMPRATVDYEIKRAFQVWADQTPLTFTQIQSGTPDITIFFAEGAHGDGNAFDGSGGTLAHAYFPRFGGDAHFDEAEYFTSGTPQGINLFQVAAHEFGHSLGLSHSRERNALMAPFYMSYRSNFRLDNDDIAGIQMIYGPPRNVPANTPRPATPAPTPAPATWRPPTTPSTPDNVPDYCADGQFDDIIMLGSKETYGFRGSYYYKIGGQGIEEAKKISDGWRGLPNNIDAAVSFPVYQFRGSYRDYTDDEIWFFKGSFLYKFNRDGRQLGGAQYIATAIRGLPSNVDSAFVWSGNSLVYIMKDNSYYRLNTNRDAVDPGYPRSLAVWTTYSTPQHKQQLSSGIDAAFEYSNGRTYFFVGRNYYRFNDQEFKVDFSYPRKVSKWWYGCRSNDIKQETDEAHAQDTFQDVSQQTGDNSSATTTFNSLLILTVAALVSIL